MRDRNPPKKPKKSPRAGGAENANDGKAPACHQDGTDQHPRCAPRPKSSKDRTGRTRDVEFIEGIEADARKVEFWRETKNRSFVMSHDKIKPMIWERF